MTLASLAAEKAARLVGAEAPLIALVIEAIARDFALRVLRETERENGRVMHAAQKARLLDVAAGEEVVS